MQQTVQEFFHDFRQEFLAGTEAGSQFQLAEFMESITEELTETGFVCVFHGKAATDYTAKLPPISHESCHPLHGKAATPEEVASRRV